MAISAVMVACFFNGLNTHVWTGWVFFAVAIGIVLIWIYTVRIVHSSIFFHESDALFRLYIPL